MKQNDNNRQDKQEKITPKLRFPEFQTASGWESSTLNKIGEFIGGGTPNTGITTYWNGNIQWFTPSELHTKYVFNSKRTITEDGLLNSSAKLLPTGALLISTRATVGEVSIAGSPCTTNQGFQSLVVNQSENNEFWYYWIINNKEELVKRSSGSTFAEIGKTEIKKISIARPTPEEQQKIADCLSSLDELIELQEQKLAALKQHKKGLMQQLFPSHNDLQAGRIVYPKLRFPQFKDCKGWEVVELREVAVINPKKDKLDNNLKVSFIPMALVSESGNISCLESRHVYEVNKGYTAFKDNDIIFAKITPCFENGKAALLNKLENGYGFGSTEFHVIRSQDKCVPDFLFAYLYSDKLLQQGKASMVGSAGQQRVPAQFFENYTIAFPSPEEQQAIAECLSSLDSLISEQSQQIGSLKTHKKGLMQQLFPTVN